MNMTSLFHQFLKQALNFVKDNSGKAVTHLKVFLNTTADVYFAVRIIFIQQFSEWQNLIAESKKAVRLHHYAYPLQI